MVRSNERRAGEAGPRRVPGWTRVQLLVDSASLLVFLAMIITGLMLRYVLPGGEGGGRWRSLWGWTRHAWGDVHYWLSVSVLALMVVHVGLHWTWIVGVVRRWMGLGQERDADRRGWLGAVFLAVLVAAISGFLWWARGQVVDLRG